METPPDLGNPYQLYFITGPNAGVQGARVSWDFLRYFWSKVGPEAWADLHNIARIS